MALNSCTADDQELPASATSSLTTPAVIITSMQGAQAASSITQVRDLVLYSAYILKSVGQIVMGEMVPSLVDKETDISCRDYGSYNYTGTYDSSTGSYDLTFTFSLCRANNFQYNGTVKAIGTAGNPTIYLGEASAQLSILNFANDYSTLISYMKAAVTYTLSGGGTSSDANYVMTVNGKISAFDYMMLSTCTLVFNKLVLGYSMSTDPSTLDETVSVTANGGVTEAWSVATLKITLYDFNVMQTKYWSASSSSFTSGDLEVNGRVTINYQPNSFCFEGTLDVSTPSPITNDYTTEITTQGALTINTNTAVQYDSVGGITVTTNGDSPLSYASEYVLTKLCNFFGMEQTTPPFVGMYGTAAGDTMTITALSMGSNLNCYTDVHVNYYPISNPISTSTITWYIDWHTGLGCTSPSSIPFEEALDITDDGTCDVGLDINGAEMDYTSGGVEHYTSTILPEGYYVVSINNYSCATDTTNLATIQIGDFLFGIYDCAYTASDGEAENANAWCRLADVRVNSSGIVDVIVPDGNLSPWH